MRQGTRTSGNRLSSPFLSFRAVVDQVMTNGTVDFGRSRRYKKGHQGETGDSNPPRWLFAGTKAPDRYRETRSNETSGLFTLPDDNISGGEFQALNLHAKV